MKKFLATVLMMAPLCVLAAEDGAATLSVTLYEGRTNYSAGEQPKFVVGIRALATSAEVLNFKDRDDLRAHFTWLTVKRKGETVVLPTVMFQHGSTNEDDYLLLKKGQVVYFEHDGRPQNLTELPPGEYSISVKLWSDKEPEPVHSNTITFRILQ